MGHDCRFASLRGTKQSSEQAFYRAFFKKKSAKHLRVINMLFIFAASIGRLAIRAESREGKTISTLPINKKASYEAFFVTAGNAS